MVEPITAAYTKENDDWSITVSGLGKELTARAPGIIAARDRADQLVERIVPEESQRYVVHLLNGSPVEFTSEYMKARLTRPSASSGTASGPSAPAKGTATKGGKRAKDTTAAPTSDATSGSTSGAGKTSGKQGGEKAAPKTAAEKPAQHRIAPGKRAKPETPEQGAGGKHASGEKGDTAQSNGKHADITGALSGSADVGKATGKAART